MSLIDLLWIVPPLAGAALGLLLRSSRLGLLLGCVLVVTSFVLFGYSVDNYSNNDCQPGEPCPIGEQIIQALIPVLFMGGWGLVLVALGRTFWNHLSGFRGWRNRPSGF